VILRLIEFKAISLKCYLCIVVIAAPSRVDHLGLAVVLVLFFLNV